MPIIKGRNDEKIHMMSDSDDNTDSQDSNNDKKPDGKNTSQDILDMDMSQSLI